MESARQRFWEKLLSMSCMYSYLLTKILDSHICSKAIKYSRIQYEICVKFGIFFLPSLLPKLRENLRPSIRSFTFTQLMDVAPALFAVINSTGLTPTTALTMSQCEDCSHNLLRKIMLWRFFVCLLLYGHTRAEHRAGEAFQSYADHVGFSRFKSRYDGVNFSCIRWV